MGKGYQYIYSLTDRKMMAKILSVYGNRVLSTYDLRMGYTYEEKKIPVTDDDIKEVIEFVKENNIVLHDENRFRLCEPIPLEMEIKVGTILMPVYSNTEYHVTKVGKYSTFGMEDIPCPEHYSFVAYANHKNDIRYLNEYVFCDGIWQSFIKENEKDTLIIIGHNEIKPQYEQQSLF